MKAFLVQHALSLVAGPLIGACVFFIHEGLQRASLWLDAQSPWVKRALTLALTAGCASALPLFGVQAPAACSSAATDAASCIAALGDAQWLTVALGAVFAEISHRVSKAV